VAGAAGTLDAAAGIVPGVGLAGVRRDLVGAGPAVGRRIVVAVEAARPAATGRGAAGHGPVGMVAGAVDGAARLARRAVAVLPPQIALALTGRGVRGRGGNEDERGGRNKRHFPHSLAEHGLSPANRRLMGAAGWDRFSFRCWAVIPCRRPRARRRYI